jgi:hypothetical protein
LQESTEGAQPIQHQCDYLGVTYSTNFRSCPFCEKLLGGPPSFPAPTAEHLNSLWAIKRVSVDYERDQLVEAEDGEFVLILDGNASHQPIVIPALTSFISKQDFYEHYQDYYHCDHPSAGEVIIIEPTVVEKVEGGWRLSEAGRLEVQQAALTTQEESVPSESPAVESGPVNVETRNTPGKPPIVCLDCGAIVDQEHASAWSFCWKCGKPFGSKTGSSRELQTPSTPDLPPGAQVRSPGPPRSTSSFPSFLNPKVPEPDSPSGSGTSAKLLIAGLVGLVLIGALIWLAVRPSPPAGPVSVTNDQEAGQAARSTNISSTSAQRPALSPEDSELLTVRERIASARPSERPQLVEDLRSAEQKYPANYRFPYERAKLFVKGGASHNEAFAALLVAAERAMNAGQAQEMLGELMNGKNTYFRRTSIRHNEWNSLVEALKNEDKAKLTDLAVRLEEKRRY